MRHVLFVAPVAVKSMLAERPEKAYSNVASQQVSGSTSAHIDNLCSTLGAAINEPRKLRIICGAAAFRRF
jgi:hypothetical protein